MRASATPRAGQRLIRAQTDAGQARISFESLPADLIEQSRIRLSWLAGAAAIVIVSISVVARYLQPEVAAAQRIWIVQVDLAASVLISLGMIGVERSGWLRPVTVLRLGLAYQVLIAAAIVVLESAMPWRSDEVVRGASSVTVWLIAFSLLVAAPPRTAVLASLAAAAMGPVAHFLVTWVLDFPPAATNRLLIYYGPCFLTAIVAGLMNVRILRLEYAAARARELGSYDLEEVLARGGMGEVWTARHRLLKRTAAVKLIRPEVLLAQTGRQAEVLLKRFEQEAQVIASLKSPHTVALYDFGMTEDGAFYYVMELLEGMDLDKLVKLHGPQPAARVVHILRQACDSLEEAHRRRMVHRDIKPTNLFLCRLGTAYDHCKILDFGLVKRLLPQEAPVQTREGLAAGTPAFMPPEVAMASGNIDGRADLYGLGCVAYWLLTGQLVFDAPSPTAAALAHVQKRPVPPSQRTEIALPEELERIILSCLEKNPDDRPPSAAALGRMLAHCPGIRPWDAEEAERWWRINMPAPEMGSAAEAFSPAGAAETAP